MTTKEQEPETVKLSPEKNNKQSETFNNNKEPYYRIEKLPKEDKGEKGKKNLFQATIKKVTEFLQRAQTIKYKGYN